MPGVVFFKQSIKLDSEKLDHVSFDSVTLLNGRVIVKEKLKLDMTLE